MRTGRTGRWSRLCRRPPTGALLLLTRVEPDSILLSDTRYSAENERKKKAKVGYLITYLIFCVVEPNPEKISPDSNPA